MIRLFLFPHASIQDTENLSRYYLYIPINYLCFDLSIYLCFYLPPCLPLPTYLPIYLPTYLYLPMYLPTRLSTCLSTYLYLGRGLSTQGVARTSVGQRGAEGTDDVLAGLRLVVHVPFAHLPRQETHLVGRVLVLE